MQVCHFLTPKNTVDVLINRFVDFFHTLTDVVKDAQHFESVEQSIKDITCEIEKTLISEALERYDINVPVIEHDGQRYQQVLREPKTYTSCAGPVEIERSLYRAKSGKCICPLEYQAGIVESNWTPAAARLSYYVTSQMSPYQGEKLFAEWGRFTPSKSSLDRLSRKLGQQWEAQKLNLSQVFSNEVKVPEKAVAVSASFDGIMLPMNKKTENGYQEKTANSPDKAFYREASCAAVCFYDEEGKRLQTLRFGRMPEQGKKTLKTQLTQTLDAILSQKPSLQLVKLADGAKDNWRFLSNEFYPGNGIEVLDYYHASEHLNNAIEAAYGKGSSRAKAHYEKYKSVLKESPEGVKKVISTLKYLSKKRPKNATLKMELNYFRNNRARMKYAETLALKLPIGSGVTEASCKTLVTQRMKNAGMRWDISGGQGVLTARSLIQSECWESGWSTLADTYMKQVTLLDNVLEFKRK